jgi:hypothetical protein
MIMRARANARPEPWNRRGPLTSALVWRTYAMPPVKGSIVQALAAGA